MFLKRRICNNWDKSQKILRKSQSQKLLCNFISEDFSNDKIIDVENRLVAPGVRGRGK